MMCGVARADDRGRRRYILVGMFLSVVLSRSSSTLHITSPQPILPLCDLSSVSLEPTARGVLRAAPARKLRTTDFYVAVPASRFPCLHSRSGYGRGRH